MTARAADVEGILAGRHERDLLAVPSVRRMAQVLAARCRERSWVRTSVASLERFRALGGYGHGDLEALLERARREPVEGERALLHFARALQGHGDSQVAALALGPKLWFRLNGVPVPWRPLPGVLTRPPLAGTGVGGPDSVALLTLIGSGLRRAELLRLRLGDLGSLDAEGGLIPDPMAEPLAVRYILPRLDQERITFLTYQARQALTRDVARRATAGLAIGPDAPIVARPDGTPATAASLASAQRRSAALIKAGNRVNVELCRATGDFFRAWGLPGSHFTGTEEFNIEDFA